MRRVVATRALGTEAYDGRWPGLRGRLRRRGRHDSLPDPAPTGCAGNEPQGAAAALAPAREDDRAAPTDELGAVARDAAEPRYGGSAAHARGLPRRGTAVPVGVVQAPPLPRREPAYRIDQAQLPRPRAVGAAPHVRARRGRAGRPHARGDRRHHEPHARTRAPARDARTRRAARAQPPASLIAATRLLRS